MTNSQRRRFVLGCAGILASARASAQKPGKLHVVGMLAPHPLPPPEALAKGPISTRLRELGWIEGQTYRYEYAYAGGREERLGELAVDLVGRKPDVIWANGPEAAVAAARATKTIPIVFCFVPFPIEQGLVSSLARPGGNITGVAWYAGAGVDAKRIELLREIAPRAKRLASLGPGLAPANPTVSGKSLVIANPEPAASEILGFERRAFRVVRVEELEPAFEAILAWGAEVLTVAPHSLLYRERERIAEFAIRNRIPSAYALRDFAEAGGLVSYAVSRLKTAARSAEYIDRILRGTKPADLPVEIPAQYELVVNLKTAKTLGITVPNSVLVRADSVLE